jgi:glutathione peroxidase
VLGFPANDFAGQEPGSDGQIAEFCRSTYGVRFPMFSKIAVKGPDQHPLYRQLTSLPAPIGGEVQWNFQKYLVSRRGEVVAKFDPRTRPDDPALVAKVEELLGEGS